jgi:hypothetical protein
MSGVEVVELDVKVVAESVDVKEKSELLLDERELDREMGDIDRAIGYDIIGIGWRRGMEIGIGNSASIEDIHVKSVDAELGTTGVDTSLTVGVTFREIMANNAPSCNSSSSRRSWVRDLFSRKTDWGLIAFRTVLSLMPVPGVIAGMAITGTLSDQIVTSFPRIPPK